MRAHYLDSSALVKRYIAEVGSDRIVALIESRARLVVSRLALLEVSATIARRARAGDLTARDATDVTRAVDREFGKRFEVVELIGDAMTRSVDVVRAHGLRAADGIQLACALSARSKLRPGDILYFVSADRELNAAATAEQFSVVDPNRD